MKTDLDLTQRLQDLHRRTAETPLFNPVFQLSLELSRLLEGGGLTLADCESLIADLECEALKSRAKRLRRLVAPTSSSANAAALEKQLNQLDFEAYRERWRHPQLDAVFTAHPTFLLNPAQTAAVARTAGSDGPIDNEVCGVPAAPHKITLQEEHDRAMQALANAQSARDDIVARVLDHARSQWPDQWLDLHPAPFRFATWVGYDMDGRTDITWAQSIRFRLAEKAERLRRYVASLESIDTRHSLVGELRAAADYAAKRADDFAGDLSDPAVMSAAANRLTADDPRKLLSLAGPVEALEMEGRTAPAERAVALKVLAAAMRTDGLGMGAIHFRVNAKQLHNAVRRRLDPAGDLDLASKGAVVHLSRAIAEVRPLKSNFAALAIESSTAIRQFLAIAEIVRHVDADSPVRMLIAECEQPATVLAALYFAKLFGVAEQVDVSPLFETESALEHGGRMLDALLSEQVYRDYVRQRGRVTIQTGFSDAGRFVGQIPASLAIERLQGRLAEAMQANGLNDVAALIFNTHGESMGRGAHPHSLADRLDWALSPWARRRFARAGIRLEPEVSFQGGDGYLLFATPEVALSTLTRIMELRPVDPEATPDSFYRRTDLSLDLYRAIKEHQLQHLKSRTYARAVNAFGLGLLNPTGSRVARRQSDVVADRETSLRQIRAIPHNAILQQLGYPVNVIAGLGSAADGSYEEIAALLTESERGRQIVRYIRAANAVASIKTVAAYGELFNSAYWASRPYRGTEGHLSAPCEALAEYLISDDRTGVFRRLATRLRVDALKLHRLLALIPDDEAAPFGDREDIRRAIGICHAIRLALFQHMFIRAVSIPAFSRSDDVAHEDVLEMVFSLRIDDALGQLRRAYPTSFPEIDDFQMTEPTDYPVRRDEGYETIRRTYIDPIEQAYLLSLRLTTVIANYFGAHG